MIKARTKEGWNKTRRRQEREVEKDEEKGALIDPHLERHLE